MTQLTKPVAIVGAGITGLTAAFYLQQRGIQVALYEASERTGGMIQSSTHGGFLTELGPNTIMTNSVEVPRLVRDLGLESRRVLPSPSATTRYIVRDGQPVRVPQSLSGAIGTGLLSLRAKLRVLAEPFIARSSASDESLADFVRRRLGGEFLDYLIDPFVAGVYAGDPEQLSIVHALPKMAALEQGYGSLVKGAVLGAKERRERNAPIASEPRMFSFDGGLRVLTDALTSRLNNAIRFCCPVQSIRQTEYGWSIDSPAGRASYGAVLFCSPAHRFPALDTNSTLAGELRNFTRVYYPPIARMAFGFHRSQVAHPLDGFGALVPRRELMSILGVLFSSSMFANRAPQDHVLLTVYAGGARNPELLHQSAEQITQAALDDLRRLLGITGTPVFADIVKMDRSIPQYNVGYGAVKQLIERIEARSPGLCFAGNFCQGISVSDCIAGGVAAADKVARFAAALPLIPAVPSMEVSHA
jgi:protoporphyrinogen/coproporphyrinogen III oxidase